MENHRKPARGPGPGKPHPTSPSARPRGERQLTDTTATMTLSMPSWSPAGPTRSQHRRRRASTRNRDATRWKTHPSRHHDKHTSSAITPPWGRLPLRVWGRRQRAARQTGQDERGAPGEDARVGAATNTASKPIGPLPGTAPPWGRGNLDYPRLEGDASDSSEQAEQAATQDLGLRVPRLIAGEQLALAISIRWVLSSRSLHLAEGTRTMPDVTIGHRTGHTTPATMDHPGQWHYVATRLMAHMGAYSLDEMNGLHWQWHQRAALRIRAAMQDHGIWEIAGSPGYQGHASGHRRPRSQDVPEPPRQAARRNSPERPYSTYSSPLQPFAPRRSLGSPHASGVQGGMPEQRQETRNPGRSRRRRRGGSSSMRIWTGTTSAPATPMPGDHHLLPHFHHPHTSRARTAGSAPRGPPPGDGRSIQLVHRLPPKVNGQPTVGRTTRHGHATKRACGQPKPYARSGGSAPPAA